ncbi:MAG: type II secretion system protein GspM [Sulfuricaulis sp.]
MIQDAIRHLSLTRLRSLPPRQQIIYFGSAAAVLLILYLSMWLPMQHELSRLRTDVPREKVQLAQMQVQSMEVNQLRASGRQSMSGGNLLATLEQSASANGLRQRISRMEPDGTDGARLSLDGVDFNALISWLANLQSQGGVRVDKATFDPLPTPGTVNAKLTLRGAGA